MLQMARFKAKQSVSAGEVRNWFAEPQAAALLKAEQEWLQQRLERCFGSYLVVYNAVSAVSWQSNIKHQIWLGSEVLVQDIYCSECLWPIQPDGADVVLLQHSLEFSRTPYDLLREAAIAVRPGGYLLLTGRNPWWPGVFGDPLWRRSHRLTAARVAEWLAVLGFSCEIPVLAHYLPGGWPLRGGRIEAFLEKRQWPLAACYMIAARKRVHATPLQREQSRRLQELLTLPVARQAVKPKTVEEQRKHE